MAMACDSRICSDNARFGQPEVGLGIIPGFRGTVRLARLIGMGMAKELIYTGRNVKADEALRIGLVNAVYPQAELMGKAMEMATKGMNIIGDTGCVSGNPIERFFRDAKITEIYEGTSEIQKIVISSKVLKD